MNSVASRYLVVARVSLSLALSLVLLLGCSGTGSPTIPTESLGSLAIQSEDTGTHGDSVRGTTVPSTTDTGSSQAYVDGEVLVVLHQPPSGGGIVSSLNSYSLRLKEEIRCRWGTVYELVITDGTPVEEMVERLRADPLVRIAEPNHIYYYAESPHFPNDPLWESDDLGADPRDSIYDQWGPAKIGASIVWNEGKGSDEVVIAVIDTGIRFDHEDLNANIWINEDEIPDNGEDDDDNGYIDDWWGWDCADDDNDPWDEGWSGSYHGTACAGVAAAVQDNDVGLTGVAPGVRVMALRTSWDSVWESNAVEAVNYAIENGADIISMSFGGAQDSEIFHEALDDAWNGGNGLSLLACAQNYESTNPHYPAAYDSVIAVGATIPFAESGYPIDEKKITKYEDGYNWGSNYGDWLTVMGFGDQYMTTSGSCVSCYYDGVTSNFFGGTSCATPMSAGVIALIYSFHPGQTAQWYRDRLVDTADDLDVPGFDNQTGYGRSNALRAVYGSDRYADQEDSLGFVPLTLPDTQVFDSIHDVPGNPHQDTEDLFRFTTFEEGYLAIELDIYTWGEDLDAALYSDENLTVLVQDSTGPNHAGSSRESMAPHVNPGEEHFLRIYSPGEGNSTTYGLRIHNTTNYLSVTGEDITPEFIHQGGDIVPLLKLTLEIGYQATLDEIIVNKGGTLPNANWVKARLYRDSNWNGVLDGDDQLIAEESPAILNRARLGDLDIEWMYHEPLVLFLAGDFSETLEECSVRFSLESYKDVATVEGVVASYTDFPIVSDSITIGTDVDPPEWGTTVGAQTTEPSYHSAVIGWNEAFDQLTPPVKYNVYYSDETPFDIGGATKLSDVPAGAGDSTDLEFKVGGLPEDIEHYFVVRAEDQAGNEDDNLVVVSCIPGGGGDPTNPEVLAAFTLGQPYDLTLNDDLLLVADGAFGLKVFDRTDPVNLEHVGTWAGDSVYCVCCDDAFGYCSGFANFYSIDLAVPSNPQLADQTQFYYGWVVDIEDDWIYVINYNNEMLGIDVSDPYNMAPHVGIVLPWEGYSYDIEINGDETYVAHLYSGLLAIDSSTQEWPYHENTFGGEWSVGLLVEGNTLYATDWLTGEIGVYDIGSDPIYPPKLGSSTAGPGGGAYDLVVRGDHAYVTRSDYGLVVFDISTPSDPDYVGNLPLVGAYAIATDGELIYVLTEDAQLHVVI